MKALFVLSIVAPVGLLAAFRLTGVLREPATVKKITVEPVTLTLPRPSEIVEWINRSVQNEWAQEGALITASIDILSYLEGAGGLPFAGHDGLVFKTSVNASFAGGLINTVKISFHPFDGNSIVFVSEERWSLRLNNATLTELQCVGTNSSDAYICALVLNSTCSINDQIYWVFLDENGSHELQITVEATRMNETSNEIITIPIKLKITSF